MLHRRETVCCLPSFTGHLLVGLLHLGLRPVQQDRLRICPLQCRQRQQNISLTCVHKAGLSFAKIPNWDGLSRQMSEPKWTQSKLRQTFQRLSSTTEGWAKIGQPTAQSFTRNNRKQKNAFIHKGRKRNFRGTTFVSALQSSEQTLSAVTGLPDKAY